ncbi:MAG TPA: hypothetical protein VK864_16325, partial [Longimicrobiales bacterium]|nr:hypothetical protein [Longimicrobiales bacterium]
MRLDGCQHCSGIVGARQPVDGLDWIEIRARHGQIEAAGPRIDAAIVQMHHVSQHRAGQTQVQCCPARFPSIGRGEELPDLRVDPVRIVVRGIEPMRASVAQGLR